MQPQECLCGLGGLCVECDLFRQSKKLDVKRQDVKGRHGYTLIELLVVSTMILILASAIMPLARVTATRTREAELRRALREMRTAIDKFKDAADLGNIGSLDIKAGSENYPADLQTRIERAIGILENGLNGSAVLT